MAEELTITLSGEERRRWTRIGVLSALAMLLGYAETFVPIPIPGVKLGLANIAVLVALGSGDVAGAFCVSVIKVLATGLLFGSPLTMAYSAAGTLLAFLGMAPLSKLKSMHLAMLSVVGAILHELGQLAVASLLLGSSVVWYTAPVLLCTGCVAGAMCGVLASRLLRSLEEEDGPSDPCTLVLPNTSLAKSAWLFALLVVLVIVVFRMDNIAALVCFAVASLCACLAAGVRPKELLGSMRPLLPLILFTLVLQLAIAPTHAFELTAQAVLRLVSISSLCLAFMKRVPTGDLTALVAKLVIPLTHLGIRTAGFVYAFDIALRLMPSMAKLTSSATFSLRDIPRLVPRMYAHLMHMAQTPLDPMSQNNPSEVE